MNTEMLATIAASLAFIALMEVRMQKGERRFEAAGSAMLTTVIVFAVTALMRSFL